MNSIRFRSFLLCVLLVAAATGAVAQTYTFPASTPNTDVLCSTCPGRETLLTVGYPPVLRFVGRWADSESAKDYQQPFRTARPKMARFVPSRNRLYTIIGSALAAYDTDKFFSRLNARPQEAMTYATGVPTAGGNPRYAMWGPPEVFLWWDAFFYAENGGGWATPLEDGLERLFDFDWDDRGNVYLAYSVFGWGVIKDNGDQGGGWFHSVSQTLRVNSLTPDHIMSLKTSDGKYYAAVSDKNNSSLMQIWDVQDPGAPVKQPDIQGRSFYLWAKDSAGTRVGIVEYSGGVSIFTTDAFVRTGTPTAHFDAGGGGTFRMITSDGTNFYAYGASGSGPFIDVISPSGSTYVEKRYPANGYGVPQGMHYGDGYLAVFGSEITAGTWNIRVYKVAPGALTEIPFEMPVPGSNGTRQLPFWSMYYSSNSPQGYTHPVYNIFMDVAPVKVGSKVYLVLAGYGLGDVWELKAGDSLSARLTAAADVPNPHSAGGSATGPFYGDRQTFTSSLSSGNVANISWDYGDNTTDTSVTNGTVKHQYGGVTSLSSLPLIRRATASNAADLTINDTVSVTLAAPQPRFQLANTSFLFRQPDASSTAPILVGDSFFDASDGAVEGHYTDWQLDGASNKHLPSDSVSVGGCGTHALVFNTHYGPYSGTGNAMASTNGDLLLSISPFNYTVRPYAITVQEPGPASVSDPNAVFTAGVRLPSGNDWPGAAGTAVTYKWDVVDANQAIILTANGSAPLGNIPSFSVPRTTFNTLGLRVRLSTTVAASAVPGAGCSGLASAVAQSSELNGPDPTIVKTGCATVGAPCSFTVTSAKNPTLAGWSFAWTVNPTVTGSGAATAVFGPQFTAATDYSVGVTVTNGIGSKTATLSGQHIDVPKCSDAPDDLNNAIGINSNTNPNPGDTVEFIMFPRGWEPSVECDKFAWTFGDGGTSTEMRPTHVYNIGGQYPVQLVLTGALSKATYTTTVTIGTVVKPPPPDNRGGCNAPLANSAYVAYTGPASGCTPVSGACNLGESLQFVLWPDSGYNLSCGNTSVTWLFGDGTSGTGLSPTHTYTIAGTYQSSATVTNSAGSFSYPQKVQVGNAAPKLCGTLTQQNVSVGFTGTNCTELSGTCKSSDAVTFRAVGTGYDFSCNATHTYDWDFGDGSAHSTVQTPAHTFSPGTWSVKLTVSNGTSTTSVTRSVVAASGSSGGNGGPCAPIIPDGNVYVTFTGDGCNAIGGNCSGKSDVMFEVNATGYDFGCAVHTYSWDFGDGGHSIVKAPSHRYTANGTYHVKVHFSNGFQPVDLNATVTVTGVGPVIPPRHRSAGH